MKQKNLFKDLRMKSIRNLIESLNWTMTIQTLIIFLDGLCSSLWPQLLFVCFAAQHSIYSTQCPQVTIFLFRSKPTYESLGLRRNKPFDRWQLCASLLLRNVLSVCSSNYLHRLELSNCISLFLSLLFAMVSWSSPFKRSTFRNLWAYCCNSCHSYAYKWMGLW